MQITAKVILDSLSICTGVRLTTFEIEVPRYLVAQLNTHRAFSRNSASSRAIKPSFSIDRILKEGPVKPSFYGQEQPGMKAKVEISNVKKSLVDIVIGVHSRLTLGVVWLLNSGLGLHKQIAGRYLEPFLTTKMIITATEFDNFFQLRCHQAAQPEIRELAFKMMDAYNKSEPVELGEGDWHAPYVGHLRRSLLTDDQIETKLLISASCCAQVSFRSVDDSEEKAIRLTNMLLSSVPPHASPFESIAMATDPDPEFTGLPKPPFTHVDCFGNFWSGNLRGWVQYRKLLAQRSSNIDIVTGVAV